MRRRVVLSVLVLLLVGAYVASYPKYPEVRGCVNPFAVVKPVSVTQENWSSVHVFFKLLMSRDFRKMAKPWDVDYSRVKVAKHVLEYKGEKITMTAIAISLKDKKHIVTLYEFSKPVQGVKVITYEYQITDSKLKAVKMGINGEVRTLSSCKHECQSDSDCGSLIDGILPSGKCNHYCCEFNLAAAAACCIACVGPGGEVNPICLFVACPLCIYSSCEEWGSYCSGWNPAGP
ncbi:hypothetical protein [Pyrococcus kukulkanii]|uniref:hypothetical protein n=1 Tax=Pyrococcus kukulkanii TaxID=1609559 RepID=UPI00356A0EAD